MTPVFSDAPTDTPDLDPEPDWDWIDDEDVVDSDEPEFEYMPDRWFLSF